MKATELREKLHRYIDTLDEAKLDEVYKIIEGEDNAYQYSAEDIAMFYDRRTSYMNGQGKNYTMEESINSIRK
jgi:hypothetical protein